MTFLFPNTVGITRPSADAGVGERPYSGLTQAGETVVAAGVPAHIQPDRQGKPPLAGTPADAAGQPTWKIVVKLPKGTIRERDVVTDELGNRYQVIYPAWTPLATTLLAVGLGA